MLWPFRRSGAARLRSAAERFDQRQQAVAERSVAPLVRLGGRWWYRGEIVAPTAGDEPSGEAR
jgi:hypothetical protein